MIRCATPETPRHARLVASTGLKSASTGRTALGSAAWKVDFKAVFAKPKSVDFKGPIMVQGVKVGATAAETTACVRESGVLTNGRQTGCAALPSFFRQLRRTRSRNARPAIWQEPLNTVCHKFPALHRIGIRTNGHRQLLSRCKFGIKTNPRHYTTWNTPHKW